MFTRQRFYEILPGALAWGTFIFMIFFSWTTPMAVSVFIILFDIYWLLKTIYLSLHLRSTFKEMKKTMATDWLAKLKSEKNDWEKVRHLIIFPMYREPYEVVRESFKRLAEANYPKEKMFVVLATEESGGDEVKKTARLIEENFKDKFGHLLVTVHPAGLNGEIPGKGANETWAAKEAKRLLIDPLVNTQTYADDTRTNAENEFLYEDLTYKIRGAVFSVRKKLGLGHKEIIYQKALEKEFMRLSLNFEREKVIEILYEDEKIGIYRPDFVIDGKIILELKALPSVGELERRQVWQYLKGSNYKLALLANFGGSDVYIKRIVYDTARIDGAQTNVERTQTYANDFFQRESASSPRKSALKYENVLVSSFDVDTQVYPEYFGRLTHAFLNSESPLRAIYQPIPFFNNNVYEAPAIARVISFSSTYWQMMQQARSERLTTFSSQSIPLQTLLDIGYWQTNVVSEDSRIFWQCFLRYHGNFRVVPLNYPVSMDANVAHSLWQTLKNLYKQQRRWGWGAENIPYMLAGFRDDKEIPAAKKRYWTFTVLEGFHSWATNSILIFALGWLPVYLGGRIFNLSLLSYNLPNITRLIVEISMVGIASSAILGILLLPPRPDWFRWYHYGLYVLQWAFIPVTLIIFGAIPGLEAQTRLMLGGKFRLGFWVTPKHRR